MANVQPSFDRHAEDSLTTTQEFCKLLLQTSLLAIPLYLGLFMIAVPYDVDAGVKKGLVLGTPVIEFAIAAAIYSVGFLLPLGEGDRKHSDDTNRIRTRTIRHKIRLILLGSLPLLLGIFSGTVMLLKAHL